MRLRMLHSADTFYLNSWTAEVENEINRLGPADLIASSLDPQDAGFDGLYKDWPKTINVIRWPQGADNYATAIFLLTDEQVDTIAAIAATRNEYGANEAVTFVAELEDGESYPPAGIPEAVEGDTTSRIIISWKMFPLTPCKVAIADSPHVGLWLCPFVCQRYFYRWGRSTTNLVPLPGYAIMPSPAYGDRWGAGIGAPTEPDLGLLGNMTCTHPSINAATRVGAAWNITAGSLGGRIVCRDVASNYSTYDADHSHISYGGIILDLPDDASRDQEAAPTANEVQGTQITGASGGTFTYSMVLSGTTHTTTDIPYNASASDVQLAINTMLTLAAVGTGVACTGGPLPSAIGIEFVDDYAARPVGKLMTNPASLTGTTPVIVQSVITPGGGSYHSDAIRMGIAALDYGYLISGGRPSTDYIEYINPNSVITIFPVADPLPPADHPKFIQYGTTPDSILLPVAANFSVSVYDGEYDWTPPTIFIPEQADYNYDAEDEDDYINWMIDPPANAAVLKRYAAQAAEYYYRWSRFPCRFKFAGIAPVMPNGHSTLIEWCFLSNDVSTTYIASNQRRGNNIDPFENWSVDVPVAAYNRKGIVSVEEGQYMGLGTKHFQGISVNPAGYDDSVAEFAKGSLTVNAQSYPGGLPVSSPLFCADPDTGRCTFYFDATDTGGTQARTPVYWGTGSLGLNGGEAYEIGTSDSIPYGKSIRHFAVYNGGPILSSGHFFGWYADDYSPIGGMGLSTDYFYYSSSLNGYGPDIYGSPGAGNGKAFLTTGVVVGYLGFAVKSPSAVGEAGPWIGAGSLLVGDTYYGGLFKGGILVSGLSGVPATAITGEISVLHGGTGVAYMSPGQVLVGSGTLPIDSLEYTRTSGEKLEFKLESNRWLGFPPPGNF